jgi:hypothetical protein
MALQNSCLSSSYAPSWMENPLPMAVLRLSMGLSIFSPNNKIPEKKIMSSPSIPKTQDPLPKTACSLHTVTQRFPLSRMWTLENSTSGPLRTAPLSTRFTSKSYPLVWPHGTTSPHVQTVLWLFRQLGTGYRRCSIRWQPWIGLRQRRSASVLSSTCRRTRIMPARYAHNHDDPAKHPGDGVGGGGILARMLWSVVLCFA